MKRKLLVLLSNGKTNNKYLFKLKIFLYYPEKKIELTVVQIKY